MIDAPTTRYRSHGRAQPRPTRSLFPLRLLERVWTGGSCACELNVEQQFCQEFHRVGVLYSQNPFSTQLPRVEVVEEGRAQPTEMERSSRGWSESQ